MFTILTFLWVIIDLVVAKEYLDMAYPFQEDISFWKYMILLIVFVVCGPIIVTANILEMIICWILGIDGDGGDFL